MNDLRDLTRIVLRDLDQFPDLLMPVLDRLFEGPIRAMGSRMSALAPRIHGDAMATCSSVASERTTSMAMRMTTS